MTTATQPSLAAEIATLRDQLHEAEAAIRQVDDELRHLAALPAGRDEVLEVVGDLIDDLVREARKPLADALRQLSRNSSLLHSPGYVANFANGEAARLQPGKYLDLEALRPVLIAIAGSEGLKRAVAEAADLVTWPDALLGEADRARQLGAANRRRDGFQAKIVDLRTQADELGVELS